MRPEARQALIDLVREYGKSIVLMPSSCRMSMAARLAAFPEENQLLTVALTREVPARILEFAGTDAYEAKLSDLARDLAAATGAAPAEATEAITAWAEALNRPVGYRRAEVPDRVYQDPKPADPLEERAVRLVMALIVAAGGFLGGALGNGGQVMAMLAVDATSETEMYGDASSSPNELGLVLVLMLLGGVAGAFGAGAGWLVAKGSDKPWAAFGGVFFGAAALGTLRWYFAGLGWSTAGAILIAAFVTASTFAIRGQGPRT
ncbi:MAG TPA: hypothetical protein VKE74_31755 [Gemmataceae bacterium]|nr:hypothetical protein [Gemmataceae bacterium]